MRDKGEIMMWNYFKGCVMIVAGWNNCIGILKLYRGIKQKMVKIKEDNGMLFWCLFSTLVKWEN